MQDHKTLKIIIVGAGLGGLIAALTLARDGHEVHLFERRPTFEPKGGAIMIRPIATRFLRQWGLQEDMEKISDVAEAVVYRDGATDQEFVRRKTISVFGGNPDWGTFREDTQAVFYKHAVAHGAKIKFDVTVTDVEEDGEKARVHLSTGDVVVADLLLAADGILSRLRSKILPDAPDPSPGWATLYQVRAHAHEILADPHAKKLADSTDLQVWMNRAGGGYIVGRFNICLQRMSGVFGIPERDHDPRLWDENGDINYVRDYFKDYSSTITSFLKIAQHCDRWRIAEMPCMPEWTSPKRRLVLLGDSIHAMFPDAAYGFSLIVEDVGVLSHLLKHHIDRGVPALMKIWQDVRQPRVNRIKDWAKANLVLFTMGPEALGAKGARPGDDVSLEEVKPDREAGFRDLRFLKWAYAFDAIKDVERFIGGQEAASL